MVSTDSIPLIAGRAIGIIQPCAAYRATKQTGAVRRESTTEKEADPPWPKKNGYLHVPCLRTSGEEGGEECLLADAV